MPSAFRGFGISSTSSPSRPTSSSSTSSSSSSTSSVYPPPTPSYCHSDSWESDTDSYPRRSKMAAAASYDDYRHSRVNSVSSDASNGGFLNNLFSSNYSIGGSGSSSNGGSGYNTPIPSHQKRQGSIVNVGAARRFSLFGLGANSNASTTSTNSLLAFSSSSSSTSSSRCCSRCIRAPSPGPTSRSNLKNGSVNILLEDEFKGEDFASLLATPTSPLNCTPNALKKLQDDSLEIINKLYNSYLARTQALKDTMSEFESLKEDLVEKRDKIEEFEQKVSGMLNVQKALTKATEDAEAAARRAKEEANTAIAERNRLAWSQRSIRMVESQPNGEEEEYGGTILDDSLASAQRYTRRPPMQSNQSDSGFESDSDSSSLFPGDLESPFASKRSSAYAPSFPPSKHSASPSTYSIPEYTPPVSPTKVSSYNNNTLPLSQMTKNVFGNQQTSVRSCDCTTGRGAWSFVSSLKEENGLLKGRVGELEDCLGACLDMVNERL